MVIYEPIKIMKYYNQDQIKGKDEYKIKKKMEQGTKAVGLVITFNGNHNYKNVQKKREKLSKYVRNGNTTLSYFSLNSYVFNVKK